MTDKEVEKLIEQRAADLESKAPQTPELLYFSGIVKSTKKRLARRQKIQFIIFIAVAVVIAVSVFLFAFLNIAIFAVIQAVPLALFCILYLCSRRTEATR
jgi:hypothetical protein